MNPEWCGVCQKVPDVGASGAGSYGFHGGETKQDVLDDVCDLLGMKRLVVSVGSSLPSEVFTEAAIQVGVSVGTMPEVCEAVILAAGHSWSTSFDSRGTVSGGGSTVTLEGFQAMRKALRSLLS